MARTGLNDLRYAYYGGGQDAEREFLEGAYANGISAATTMVSGTTLTSVVNDGTVSLTADATPGTSKAIPELIAPQWTATFTGHVQVSTSKLNVALAGGGDWEFAVWGSLNGGGYTVGGQFGHEQAQVYQYLFPGYTYSAAQFAIPVTEGATYDFEVRMVNTVASQTGTLGVGSALIIKGL